MNRLTSSPIAATTTNAWPPLTRSGMRHPLPGLPTDMLLQGYGPPRLPRPHVPCLSGPNFPPIRGEIPPSSLVVFPTLGKCRASRAHRGPTAPKPALERDVAVLSLRLLDPLGLQGAQGADQLRARLVGDDHVVDVAALGRRVGVGESRLVVGDQLLAALVGRRRALDVATED